MWSKCWAVNSQGVSVPWGIGTSLALTFNLNGGGYLLLGTGPGSFYQWVVSQIGPINPGDSFVFDMLAAGMCTSPWGSDINKVCIKYDGLASGSGMGWNGTAAQAHTKGCCDPVVVKPCDDFNALNQQIQDGCCEKCKSGSINPNDPCFQHCDCCPEPPKTSWDCEEVLPTIIDDTNPNNPTHQCVQKNHTGGQFATAQDCISSGCGVGLPGPGLQLSTSQVCTYNDLDQQMKNIMAVAYGFHPVQQTWIPNWINTSGYYTFRANMWNGYSNFGCGWWTSKVSQWQGIISSGVNAQGNPLGPYQLQLLNGKISFAQTMHNICNCPGPTPIIVQPISKMINNIDIDYTDIPTSGGTKDITINGTNGAEFYLEIKNEDSKYYNFTTRTFTTKYNKLDEVITNGKYTTTVSFPAVADDDQYDIYIYAKEGTSHVERQSALFRDGSLDLNSSTGSNNLLLQKVLHQVLDVRLTLNMYSSGGLVPGISVVNDTVDVGRYNGKQSQSFTLTATRSTNALTVDRQPEKTDILTFLEPVVGSAPIQIPGENIYPAVTGTDTVNGARNTDAVAVTMDSAVATIMAVGDRVTGNADLNAGVFTVVSLDSTNVFSISSVVAIADGVTLSFSNQMNYRWPVANAVNLKEGMIVVPDTNVASGTELAIYQEKITLFEDTEDEKELILKEVEAVDKSKDTPTVSQGRETVAPGSIVFNNQMPLALAEDTLKVGGYGLEEVKRVGGWDISFNNLKVELNKITTLTNGAVSGSTTITVDSVVGIADETTQTVNGAITSSNKVILDSVDGLFVGQTMYAVSAGTLSGNPTITSVNEVTKAITLSSVQTFADGITLTFANSVISGIGIDPAVINPYVTNISGSDLTASATQTLEDDQTLTFTGSGNIATLTGDIIVNKAGSENLTLRFDVDKFLTYHS